jgi:hypothetical protein
VALEERSQPLGGRGGRDAQGRLRRCARERLPGGPKLGEQILSFAMLAGQGGEDVEELGRVSFEPWAQRLILVAELRRALTSRIDQYEAVAQWLYQLVMAPIVPLLGTKRRLLIAPDGDLLLVPFAALHDGQQYLLDTYDISYLTSGRDLLPRPTDP